MIKFTLKSLFCKDVNDNKKTIPFEHLLSKSDNCRCEEDDCQCNVDIHILTKRDSIFKLPKYHQRLLDVEINYNKYILIYASIGGENVRGCEVKIDKIQQKGNQVIVKIKRFVPALTGTFSLEVVNVPYDVVKIRRSKLMTTELLDFKFIDYHDKILYSTYLKLD